MPTRDDTALWFNKPGIVAAYQPVRAPGPTLARYNMAMGGNDLYRAADGVAPIWTAAQGWIFTGTEYLLTGVTKPDSAQTWSILARFTVTDTSTDRVVINDSNSRSTSTGIIPRYGAGNYRINQGGVYLGGGHLTSSIAGMSGATAFVDGRVAGAIASASYTPLGMRLSGLTGGAYPLIGTIKAVVIYGRILSASEMWAVTYQMAYCDVNPDWSAWGRRRKWFYLAPAQPAVDLYVGPFQDVVVR